MLKLMQYIVAVGSNLGDRAAFISTAEHLLSQDQGIEVIRRATHFENPAQGGPRLQSAFLNSAWVLETELGPHQLLARLQRIETQLGRVRTVFHGPRSIDLDIIFCDQFPIIDSTVLQVPHPSMHIRDFVLVPINEIAPDWIHPILGRSCSELMKSFNE